MTAAPSRTETAYQALRQSIIEQALPPGTRLPEDVIGGQFGMSRTLTRATLARLQVEGLVEAGRKRTATVARPSLEEAKEDFEVRRALEREVIRLVIARWKPEFGAVLEGHVREEDQAKSRHDAKVSIRLAGEFHIKLAETVGQSPAAALSVGSGVALLAHSGAVRPAAFLRMRGQRASRNHRGASVRRRKGRDGAHGQARRPGRGARVDRGARASISAKCSHATPPKSRRPRT